MNSRGPFVFGAWDAVVVGLYVATMVAIGMRCRLRSLTRETYFLGGRRFGALVQSFAYFGQAAAPDGPVGVATTTFHNGIAGVWSSLLMVFCTPLCWIAVPWLRRLRVLTMGDFYVERYGSKRMGAVYAGIATVGMMSLLSVGYIAVAKTAMAAIFNPAPSIPPVSLSSVIWILFAIVAGNALLGGLTAAFHSALLQSCLILLLSFILIPFGLARIGVVHGTHGLRESLGVLRLQLPPDFFRLFGSASLPDFTWYYISAICVVAGVTVLTMPNQLVANGAARSESAARAGMLTGSFAKRICTLLWAASGLVTAAIYRSTAPDSDQIWGMATRDLLGPAGCGLIGLMLIGLLSALMAASNLLVLTISGLVVNNLYRPVFRRCTEQHYVGAGRLVGGIFLAGAALIATEFDTVLEALKFSWEFFSIFAGAFWLGLKWRRANRPGAWASILLAAGAFYAVPAVLPLLDPALRTDSALALQPRGSITETRSVHAALSRSAAASDPAEPAVFWSEGLRRNADGRLSGGGSLYLELVLLRAAGLRLEANPEPLNETIRLAIRLFIPFLILAIVSLATRPDDPVSLERFFAKMRTRATGGEFSGNHPGATVRPDDDSEIVARLFPGSNWELYRWNREDAFGFVLSVLLVALVLALVVSMTAW